MCSTSCEPEFIALHYGDTACELADLSWQLFQQDRPQDPSDSADLQMFSRGLFSSRPHPRTIFGSPFASLSTSFANYHPTARCWDVAQHQSTAQHADENMERIRQLAEGCNRLDGFFSWASFNGDACRDLVLSRVLQSVADDYGKQSRVGFTLIPEQPSLQTDATALIAFTQIQQSLSVNITLQLSALQPAFSEWPVLSPAPSVPGLLRAAEFVADITAPVRHHKSGIRSRELYENSLVPYPSMNTLLAAASNPAHSTFAEQIGACAEHSNYSASVDFSSHKVMAATIVSRETEGCAMTSWDSHAFNRMKHSIPFVSWSPLGVRMHQCPEARGFDGRMSARKSMLCNSTAVSQVFKSFIDGAKRTDHSSLEYGQDFVEAKSALDLLLQDYKEIDSDDPPSSGDGEDY